jgi:acyl-CoA synthetase (NDP forming)
MTSVLLHPNDDRDATPSRPSARGAGTLRPPQSASRTALRPGPALGGTPVEATDRSVLQSFLAPRSVAVVGAGQRHGGVGHETLRALRDYGFRGEFFAVNRSGGTACGLPAYRDVADLPGPVDLVVIAGPADGARTSLGTAGRLGTRAALLLGAGLSSSDPAGAGRRAELLRTAREFRIRLLGPDSLGVLNADPAVRLNASLAPFRPSAGGVALAAGAGGLGIALLQSAIRDRCGLSTFVSVGAEADLTTAQLLDYWLDDPATRVAVLSHQPDSDPDGFARSVRAFARRKPVVAIVGGHPSAPGDDLCTRDGVIRTASVGDALDAARMLSDQPLPAGNRMAIVGNAGDLTVHAAGAARAHGFDIVPLSGSTRAQLPYCAGARRCDNPVDLGLGAAPERIAEAAETVAHSDEADVLLLMLAGTRANVPAAITSALARVIDGHPGLTVAVVLTGHTDDVHGLGDRCAPVFREPEQATRALARSLRYAQWRDGPPARRAGGATFAESLT